ncbi:MULTISPECIES: UbiA-like protein EboC [Cyanophyceae]|nr:MULTISPECIES: UbiA-like protein EboC [Cyanophyceae]MDB9306484.1 UbiA-like protein EboC [Nodularia spumigena CS-591/12]MDB9320357.1 UbiA-like protein EboC [Nodularia spumigena CS-591/07A]MDB9331490.1 UbiA-like protein EboC [Nodularia spumigena CS-591/04]MDB9341725.1 UbiA-like protein EboC [Nodularia spumigena CS-589/07]MDB9363048.1 UbiA-like protein EboC [Nodularia spumigena CS-588/02]
MNTAILKPHRLWAYLQLIRPANIVTAWADILAGFAASEYIVITNQATAWEMNLIPLAWLLLATTGLYGGGIVFNDVFDTDLDTEERPERPIPSGRASRRGATLLGSWLLSIGIVAASQVSWLSAILALGIAVAALFYDAFGKHHPIFGPVNMGICRGGNLLLGVSVLPTMVGEYWFLALIPIVYIAAITLLSRGEVHGAKLSTGVVALSLIVIVISGLLGLGLFTNYQLLTASPFLIFFTIQVLLPFIKALREPTPEKIRFAVKAGILSLIILDTTIVAGFAGLSSGLVVLSLLPISLKLAHVFAVT